MRIKSQESKLQLYLKRRERTKRTDYSSQRRLPQHNWMPLGGGTERREVRRAGGRGKGRESRGRAWDSSLKGEGKDLSPEHE